MPIPIIAAALANPATTSAIISGVGGLVKGIGGGIQARKARKAAAEAQGRLEERKAQFAALDTSNPYANMENVYEDLTVDQRAADFQMQQSMQSQANVMQQMRGAAGSSGIAGLAQVLANQGALSAQRASASIAQQERVNQLKALGEEARLQGLEQSGELMSRQLQFQKLDALMGMDATDVAAARAQQAAGRKTMWGGVGDVAKAGASYVTGGGMDESFMGDWNAARVGAGKTTIGGGASFIEEDDPLYNTIMNDNS